MDLYKLIIDKLEEENINAEIGEFEITYKTENDKHFIGKDNIEFDSNKLAWFQSSTNEKHLLRVFENEKNFNWITKTHNQSWDCDCHLLEWFKGYLIFIYKEKHDTYICSIKDGIVKTFNFHGEALERQKEIIFFKEYGEDCNDAIDVRRIKIPELEVLSRVTVESLRELKLVPQSQDIYLGMLLKGK